MIPHDFSQSTFVGFQQIIGSKGTCRNCNGKHHTSIRYKPVEQEPSVVESYLQQQVMATREQDVIYPIVIILVDGIKCRALLDIEAGGFYILSELARHLEQKPL